MASRRTDLADLAPVPVSRDGMVRRTRMVILLHYGPVCAHEAADLDAAARKHKSACIRHVPACSVHMSARCVAPAVIDNQGGP